MNFLRIISPVIVVTSIISGTVDAQSVGHRQSSQTEVKNNHPPRPNRPLNPRQVYEKQGTEFKRNGEPCIFAPDLWIPAFTMADRTTLSITGFPGEFEDYLLCGEANIQYYYGRFSNSEGRYQEIQPPQEFPPSLPPGQMIPTDNPAFPLTKCRFDEGVWDCDDYAYTWCKLQPNPEDCKILFLFTYGFGHAMVIWRTENPDGTWTVCIVEPATGAKVACWQSEDGELVVPAEYFEFVQGEICKAWGLDCESWWIESFWRFRYRDPNDWSNWLCGEKPWWDCENEEDLEMICNELRRNGIDPCEFNPECPGCNGDGGGSLPPRDGGGSPPRSPK